MKALSIAGASLLCASMAWAQSTQPSEGLMMSRDQIHKRLLEMNRRAATRPAVVQHSPEIDTARASYADINRWKSNVLGERIKAIGQLKVVEARGRAAEARLRQLLQEYHVDAALASQAGYSFFQSGSSTNINEQTTGMMSIGEDSGTINTSTTGGQFTQTYGTQYDPGKQLAAILAVKDRYGPAFEQATKEVNDLYQQKQELQGRIEGLMQEYLHPPQLREAAPAAVAAPPSQDADAIWAEISARYPGVDVKAIWQQCVRDAIAEFGANDPNIRAIATGMLNERCAAAERSAATRPAASGDIFDKVSAINQRSGASQ